MNDSVALFVRHSRIERHIAQCSSWQSAYQIVDRHLFDPAASFDGRDHAVGCLSDCSQGCAHAQSFSEGGGEHLRQSAVPTFDTKHLLASGRALVCELFNKRQQRQLLGIGEKKPSKAARRLTEVSRRANAIEPLRDRFMRQRFGDDPVPSLFAQTEASDFGLKTSREIEPAFATADSPAAAASTNGGKSTWQNLRAPKSHGTDELADFVL
jgi:hypothetical protein